MKVIQQNDEGINLRWSVAAGTRDRIASFLDVIYQQRAVAFQQFDGEPAADWYECATIIRHGTSQAKMADHASLIRPTHYL